MYIAHIAFVSTESMISKVMISNFTFLLIPLFPILFFSLLLFLPESKDYGSFGIRPRTKSAVTSSSSSWTPLLTDGSSSDSTWPPLAASSKRGVDDGVTPPKRSKMAASTNDFSPSSSSTPAKPARKIATVLFAADTRITTPPSLNKNSKGALGDVDVVV